MLKCKIDVLTDGYVEFECPKCGTPDVAYISTPDYCYKCGQLYPDDIHAIIVNLKSRLDYHFEKEV